MVASLHHDLKPDGSGAGTDDFRSASWDRDHTIERLERLATAGPVRLGPEPSGVHVRAWQLAAENPAPGGVGGLEFLRRVGILRGLATRRSSDFANRYNPACVNEIDRLS